MIKKLVIGFAVVALALVAVSPASAETIDELLAQIARLRAEIAAFSGGTSGGTTGGTTYTRDLTIGSTGADVSALQAFLVGRGMGTFTPTGYFGPLTKAALQKYQASVFINATGYFGPLTRANLNSLVVVPPSPPPGGGGVDDDDDSDDGDTTLGGGAGSINDVDYVTGINNEKVGEDEEDQEAVGLTIEADDGSDLEISAVNLNFSKSTGATHDFLKYASEVSVWLGGKEYARLDADKFTKNNNYDKNVTLDSGAIIKAGKKGDLVVKVSGVGNMDSADEGDLWTVEIESVRYEDASGAIVTDSTTGDINDGAGRSFSFESFATAVNAELKIAEDDQDINTAHVIDVHATDDTLDVPVLSFTLEAKGDSDLTLNDIGASTTVTGATDVDHLVKEITLWLDGEEIASGEVYASETSPATQKAWKFDDIDYTIAAGDKIDGEIKVSFNSVADDLDEGDTLAVDIAEEQTDDASFWDVEDEAGNQLADGDITGTATADASSVYDSAIQVVLVGTPTATNDNASDSLAGGDDTGDYKITFDVTAFGENVYIDGDVTATSTSGTTYGGTLQDGIQWGSTTISTSNITGVGHSTHVGANSSTTPLTALEVSDSHSNDVTTTGQLSYYIQEGSTRRFTLHIQARPQDTGSTNLGVRLRGIAWDTDSGDAHDTLYNFDLGAFQTGQLRLDAS